ncbi:MAG: CotH kinase family protein [Oscillospiraceae bacterium]|nr:CotH kinase family protein [Oscillospiraceae bacterium]
MILIFSLSVNTFTVESFAAKSGVYALVINEVCADNDESLTDSDGDSPDWIEIYNPTSKAVSLEGVGVSDSKKKPFKWTLPDVTIKAGGYLIIYCSDKDTTENGELHTNFKLSGGSETVYLTAADGTLIDSVELPDVKTDLTYGRYPNGTGDFTVLTATPGKSNANATKIVSAPTFSKESGFYDESFKLTITAESGTTIYYTTDGSTPTTSSTKYSGSINIKDRSSQSATYMYIKGTTVDESSEFFPSTKFEQGTVVRAIAVDSSGNVSDVATATYFIGEDISEKYDNVSVISVVIDPDDLYDDETGIYVAGNVFSEWRKSNPTGSLDGSTPANYNQRGIEWERDAHIDYFEDTALSFAVDCGVRIHGGWSRDSQQKSLKFYMRSEYGDSTLEYDLFENNTSEYDGTEILSYRKFVIRNGGNDSFSLKFKDAWTQSLVTDFNFATQADELVICFLNGEYWGVYTLNEIYDDNYVESHYGVPSDDVIMMKAGELEEGEDGEEDLLSDAIKYITSHDMSVDKYYEEACELFDMESFADYMAVEIYIGNQDWLWGNWACWRSRSTDMTDSTYQDGKWRFMLYDTEYSMDLYSSGADYKYDLLSSLLSGDGYFSKMLTSLLESDDFMKMFIVSMEKTANIAFDPDTAADALDEYYDEYSPYLAQHFKRYIGWQSLNGIKNNVSSWKTWLQNRYDYYLTLLKNNLGISTTTKRIRVSVWDGEGGTVYIEGVELTLDEDGDWYGYFLPGYSITITAVADEGYEFTGWTGSYKSTSTTIKVNPKGNYGFTANFEKIED